MRVWMIPATLLVAGFFSMSVAEAACKGSNGRGWGSGKGAGKFTMTTTDKACHIGFTNIIDDRKRTKIAATKVVVTRAPKSGKVAVTGKGIVYTPTKGFKGRDTFCTRNSAPKVPRTTLSGCITVTVR